MRCLRRQVDYLPDLADERFRFVHRLPHSFAPHRSMDFVVALLSQLKGPCQVSVKRSMKLSRFYDLMIEETQHGLMAFGEPNTLGHDCR